MGTAAEDQELQPALMWAAAAQPPGLGARGPSAAGSAAAGLAGPAARPAARLAMQLQWRAVLAILCFLACLVAQQQPVQAAAAAAAVAAGDPVATAPGASSAGPRHVPRSRHRSLLEQQQLAGVAGSGTAGSLGLAGEGSGAAGAGEGGGQGDQRAAAEAAGWPEGYVAVCAATKDRPEDLRWVHRTGAYGVG